MENASTLIAPGPLARWRELVWPREHGSWALALEPLALGLLVAPSAAGAWLAFAVLAAFFARRPLRIVFVDVSARRRAAARGPLIALALVAAGCFTAAIAIGGTAWLGWLAPIAIAGTVFLSFDLRAEGRAEVAEVAGAAAFALLPGALAALAGWRAPEAAALAFVMCGRSVPTVLCVRAVLRAQKIGEPLDRLGALSWSNGRRFAFALVAALLAVVVGAVLAHAGFVPRTVVGLLGFLAVRAVALLLFPRPELRPRTIGAMEAGLGVLFVTFAAVAWRV